MGSGFDLNDRWSTSDRKPFSFSAIYGTGDAGNATIAAARTGHTIYVRHVQISINTSAAQSITVKDDAGTALVVASLANSSGVGPHEWDFGTDGCAVTAGQALVLAQSSAGNAYAITVHGYWRQTSALSMAQAALA